MDVSSPRYETLSVLGVRVGVLDLHPLRSPTGAPRGRCWLDEPGPPPPAAAAPPQPGLELSSLQTLLVRKNNELASPENWHRVHNAIAGLPGQQGE